MANFQVPDFDNLSNVEGMPKGCAWGVFDKNDKKDHLGCLNFLTPNLVKEAYKEAQIGISVSLNWPVGALAKPGFNRKGLEHKVIDKNFPGGHRGFDDEITFNTQCSSQWDSLVHYQHQATQTGYNGCRPTPRDLEQPYGQEDRTYEFPSLNHWHDRGGVVGRGVLLDYRGYADAKGISFSSFEAKRITVEELERVAEYQKTILRYGDILLIRTGFTEDLAAAPSAEAQAEALSTHKAVGVEGNEKAAKWFWDKRFSAVASDAIAFEALPPLREDGSEGGINELGS